MTFLLMALLIAAGNQELAAQAKKKSAKKKATSSSTVATQPGAAKEPTQKLHLSERPQPLEATDFRFPSFEEFTLPNGLHVYVISNNEQPVLTVNVMMRAGEAYDPAGKEGVAALMGDMLGKGAGKRSASDIALALDNVGASVSATAGAETFSITASALKKYADLVLGVLADQIVRPTFPDDELAKLKQQYLANISAEKSRPMDIAQALARKVIYGFDSPLARRKSEASITAATKQDLTQFHGAYVRPNNASIAFVGDVTAKEVRAWLSTHFALWTKGDVPNVTMPDIAVAPAAVYFIPRKGAVQSGVIVTAAAPAQKAPDYPAVDLLTEYLGSGFGSRLFSTLRETYSYTYSPFGFATQGKRYNRIALGAEVRTSVTDSAIAVILREVKSVASSGPDYEALDRKKAFAVGQYRLGMESAGTVATILQYAWANERNIEDVKRETDLITSLSVADVQQAAQRYLDMFNLRLVVIGDPSIRPALEQFGSVREFNLDLEPADANATLTPAGVSLDQIVERYVQAVGGTINVEAVQSLSMTGALKLRFQGTDIAGTLLIKRARPNKAFVNLSTPLFMQRQWVDGEKGWTSLDGKTIGESPQDESVKLMLDELMFAPTQWKRLGYQLSPKGKRPNEVIVEGTDPANRAVRFHFDETSWLLTRRETDELSAGELITTIESYSDYRPVGNVQLPHTIRISNTIFSMECNATVTINDVQDGEFRPKE